MQDKLCIIISSEYPETESVMNNEVQQDLATVEETLADYTCIKITIPVKSSEVYAKKLTAEVLKEIPKHYANCHIVLNTHGAGGANDIKDEVVKMVVQDMSEKGVPITQLSALQCNGMLGLSAAEVRAANPMTPEHKKVYAKKASMEILCEKLNAMTTAEQQNFAVRGFVSAYDPIEDHAKIVDLLNGEGGVAITVSTQPYIPFSPTHHAREILDNVAVIKECLTKGNYQLSREYISANNMLGLAITDMREKLLFHIESGGLIPEIYLPLLEAVSTYASNPPHGRLPVSVPLSARDFKSMYKHWLKDYKVHSSERLDVFRKYAETMCVEASTSTKARLRSLSTSTLQSISPCTTDEDSSSLENNSEGDEKKGLNIK